MISKELSHDDSEEWIDFVDGRRYLDVSVGIGNVLVRDGDYLPVSRFYFLDR